MYTRIDRTLLCGPRKKWDRCPGADFVDRYPRVVSEESGRHSQRGDDIERVFVLPPACIHISAKRTIEDLRLCELSREKPRRTDGTGKKNGRNNAHYC